jgi:hypothetical protein
MSSVRLDIAFRLRGISSDAKLLAIYLADNFNEFHHNAAFDAALAFDFCQFEDDEQMSDALTELVNKGFLTEGNYDREEIAVGFSYVRSDGYNTTQSTGYRKKPIPKELRLQVFERDGHRCVYCGCEEGPFQADHVVPESKGGAATVENLACACIPCNRSKGARTPEEWRGG